MVIGSFGFDGKSLVELVAAGIVKSDIVIVETDSIVAVLTANIEVDGFTLKLPCFGKFEVRHKKGRMRRIPLTGKIQKPSTSTR